MTVAPASLKALQNYLHERTGLAWAALGIVGDSAHRGGYHCGSDRVVSGDYSVTESRRDRDGLSLAASALDIGSFARLRELSLWIVEQCKAGAADTLDIREVIYSPDGATVRRWDRLGRRTTGDDSHRWHTHISFFRDAEHRDKTALFKRFFEGGEAHPTVPAAEEPHADTGTTDWAEEITMALETVKKGSRGAPTKRCESLLAANGHPPANSFNSRGEPDGIAGTGVDRAIRAFQRAKHLVEDGICGRHTWTKLLGQ